MVIRRRLSSKERTLDSSRLYSLQLFCYIIVFVSLSCYIYISFYAKVQSVRIDLEAVSPIPETVEMSLRFSNQQNFASIVS